MELKSRLAAILLFLFIGIYITLGTFIQQGLLNRLISDDWEDATRGDALLPGMISYLWVGAFIMNQDKGAAIVSLIGLGLFVAYQALYLKKVFVGTDLSFGKKSAWFSLTALFFLLQTISVTLTFALAVSHSTKLAGKILS